MKTIARWQKKDCYKLDGNFSHVFIDSWRGFFFLLLFTLGFGGAVVGAGDKANEVHIENQGKNGGPHLPACYNLRKYIFQTN